MGTVSPFLGSKEIQKPLAHRNMSRLIVLGMPPVFGLHRKKLLLKIQILPGEMDELIPAQPRVKQGNDDAPEPLVGSLQELADLLGRQETDLSPGILELFDRLGRVFGEIPPSASVDSRFYSNGTRWLRTITGVGLKKTFSRHLSLGFGYAHYVLNSGTSPFNFEIYRFNASDRFTSDLSFLIGETDFGAATSYFISTWQPEDIDYSMRIRMHCYDLMLKYRSVRKEFELGFSLAGG